MSGVPASVARPRPVPDLDGFVGCWAGAIDGTSYVAMSRVEIEKTLRRFTVRLADALVAEPFRTRDGYKVGNDLVGADFVTPEALSCTVEVLYMQLLPKLGLDTPQARVRLARLVGALVAGFTRTLRDRTLHEQETICRAALIAQADTETALRASEARYRHHVLHDALTGLPNRALLRQWLEGLFAGPSPGSRAGLCFMDIDRFKAVNDTLGYQVGDRLLVAVADRLTQHASVSGHLVARMGGDEFALLVAEPACADDVIKIADRALGTFAEPFLIDGHRLSITASIGVVQLSVADTDPAELMRAADITLHWAKAEGRARWVLFDPRRNAHEVARYVLSAAMPAALEHDEFVLHYQPLVGLVGGDLQGFEALARWNHPTLGLVGPDQFIGVAEETGIIVPLGRRLLQQACHQAAHWQKISPDAPFVSVNLAARQTRQPNLVADITNALNDACLPAHRLQLEITENAVISTDDDTVHTLHTLAALGVRIAIDDFGTGYSNLAYLSKLPVHTLKLARNFTHPLRSTIVSNSDNAIITSLVTLGHVLGLTVTAEGVETATQAQRLQAIGCDTGQGWYLGRPQEPQHLDGLLTAAA